MTALDAGDPLADQPWRATAADDVAGLLAALPRPNPFTVGTRLQRRLLLAASPAGADGIEALRARLQALLASGDIDAAKLLLRLAGTHPELDRVAAQIALAGGDADGACNALFPSPSGTATTTAAPVETAGQDARLACTWLEDGPERAGLSVQIAAERGDPGAPDAQRFLDILKDGDLAAMLKLAEPARSLASATLATATAVPDPEAIRTAPPPVQAMLARNPHQPAASRLLAARLAAAAGALDPATLRQTMLADAATGKRLGDIDDASVPTIKAERLRDAWLSAPEGMSRLLLAQALSVDVQAVDPSIETVAAAVAAVPIAMLAGDTERVRHWQELLAFLTLTRADIRDVQQSVAPYLALAGIEKLDPHGQPHDVLVLLSALGRIDPPVDWLSQALTAQPAEQGTPPPVAVQKALQAALEAGGRGSVAVLALRLLGDRPDKLDIGSYANALAALDKAGFPREAAQLAAARLMISPAAGPT